MRLALLATATTSLVVAAHAEPLVDVAKACPGIQIELRYATARNVTGKPIYPANARALVTPGVAERLNRAHRTLQARGFGLKIWDAYRPQWVQRLLWNQVRDRAFVVEPGGVGSLHSWGAAVDVTLVDFGGREVRMPTDFDAFTKAARYDYAGQDAEIAANVKALQRAMADAGFRHIRDEWWHYSAPDQLVGTPPDVPLALPVKGEVVLDTPSAPASEKSRPRPARLPPPPRPASPP